MSAKLMRMTVDMGAYLLVELSTGDVFRVEPDGNDGASRFEPIDWPAFWRSLPPREQWEAAKAMPKIAGPWGAEGGTFVRPTFAGVEFQFWQCGELFEAGLLRGDGFVYCGKRLVGTYPDRASADAALRAADWILVDEETKP